MREDRVDGRGSPGPVPPTGRPGEGERVSHFGGAASSAGSAPSIAVGLASMMGALMRRFRVAWKAPRLLLLALPFALAGPLDASTQKSVVECLYFGGLAAPLPPSSSRYRKSAPVAVPVSVCTLSEREKR